MNQIICLLIVFLCCKENKDRINSNETKLDKKIDIAFANVYRERINQDFSFMIYKNDFFYFINKNINKNYSRSVNDFYLPDNLIKHKDFLAIHHKLIESQWLSINTKAFFNEKCIIENIIKKRQIKPEKSHQLCNKIMSQLTMSTSYSQISNCFLNDLENGKFFKTIEDFYILLVENAVYIIKYKQLNTQNKFMLHFVRKDNSFLNMDFYFMDKSIQEHLQYPFNNYKIAKIDISELNKYCRIRVGQFNNKGNIWAKEIDLKDVFDNELLIYQNEFNN
jgi:hypothetical protein